MISKFFNLEKREQNAILFLRWGLAFVFIYSGISGLVNPSAWIGFVPEFVERIMSRETFLIIHDIFNLAIGTLLIYGKKVFYVAGLAALSLLAIVLGNIPAFIITFRDVGLLLAALALAVLSYEKN